MRIAAFRLHPLTSAPYSTKAFTLPVSHRHRPFLLQNESADAAQAAVLAGLPPPKGDVDFWRTLQQFTLNNAHYYCETADISRPFPRWVLGKAGWAAAAHVG